MKHSSILSLCGILTLNVLSVTHLYYTALSMDCAPLLHISLVVILLCGINYSYRIKFVVCFRSFVFD